MASIIAHELEESQWLLVTPRSASMRGLPAPIREVCLYDLVGTHVVEHGHVREQRRGCWRAAALDGAQLFFCDVETLGGAKCRELRIDPQLRQRLQWRARLARAGYQAPDSNANAFPRAMRFLPCVSMSTLMPAPSRTRSIGSQSATTFPSRSCPQARCGSRARPISR
jgi:hypothetical protein